MDRKIAVVGLGYVGLPLAVAFGRRTRVIGFDVNERRVAELRAGHDGTREVADQDLKASQLDFTSDVAQLAEADFVIVAVPTPINNARRPDLTPLKRASETVGSHLARGAIVVFEFTVYPGVTEDVCGPILERCSGLRCGRDFFLGYSPERINPGDKKHTLQNVVKIVAGQTPEVLEIVAGVYSTVVTAGVHRAPSIKTAEAAKVIENTQRDLNIALVNELSMIFDRMGIDTLEVLRAAGTKWNFLPFRPGLVGGHCIGVDPYYLTHKAEELGYHPQVILAGRRINDGMGLYVAQKYSEFSLSRAGTNPNGARIGVLGMTFKEDVPDLRNSRVADIVAELREYGATLLLHDPVADAEELRAQYDVSIPCVEAEALRDLDAVIVAVAHKVYRNRGAGWVRDMLRPGGLVVYVKGLFEPDDFVGPGHSYWRL